MGNSTGYYSVVIDTGTQCLVHTVFAQSDYAAAREVRRKTGFMAKSDHDVSPLFAQSPTVSTAQMRVFSTACITP